jgi:hypothetical protein
MTSYNTLHSTFHPKQEVIEPEVVVTKPQPVVTEPELVAGPELVAEPDPAVGEAVDGGDGSDWARELAGQAAILREDDEEDDVKRLLEAERLEAGRPFLIGPGPPGATKFLFGVPYDPMVWLPPTPGSLLSLGNVCTDLRDFFRSRLC